MEIEKTEVKVLQIIKFTPQGYNIFCDGDYTTGDFDDWWGRPDTKIKHIYGAFELVDGKMVDEVCGYAGIEYENGDFYIFGCRRDRKVTKEEMIEELLSELR